jgi:hypothetical protein
MILLFDITPIKTPLSQSLFQLMDLNILIDETLIDAAEIGLIPATPQLLEAGIREVLHTYAFNYDHDARVYSRAFRETVFAFHELFHRSRVVFTQPHWPHVGVKRDLLLLSTRPGIFNG